jgi:hypothetical protein
VTDENPGQWALRYAAGGLPVLPLHSIRDGRCTCGRDCGSNAGKHPLTAHGKDDATIDLERVIAWWARWMWANVGVIPLPGLIVLDVDPRNGGDTALAELVGRHGPLPLTLTARTGGGGLHMWFAYAGPARGKLCTGVDVKTWAGYVVAPPSRHLTGRRYEWATGLATARAPEWVRRILSPPLRPMPAGRTSSTGAGLARVVRSAPPGGRNNALNWATYRAYQGGADPGLIDEIRTAALNAGLPAAEVDRTIASAARGGLR